LQYFHYATLPPQIDAGADLTGSLILAASGIALRAAER